MKLEPRSGAFVSNQPSRLSPPQQQQQQEQEQLKEQQQQVPTTVFPYSLKLESDAKGQIKISVHTYSDNLDKVRKMQYLFCYQQKRN